MSLKEKNYPKEMKIAFSEYKAITKSLLAVLNNSVAAEEELAAENAALKRALRKVLAAVEPVEPGHTDEFSCDFTGLAQCNPYED